MTAHSRGTDREVGKSAGRGQIWPDAAKWFQCSNAVTNNDMSNLDILDKVALSAGGMIGVGHLISKLDSEAKSEAARFEQSRKGRKLAAEAAEFERQQQALRQQTKKKVKEQFARELEAATAAASQVRTPPAQKSGVADNPQRNRAKKGSKTGEPALVAVGTKRRQFAGAQFAEFPAITGNEVRFQPMLAHVTADGGMKRVIHRVQIASITMPSSQPTTFTELSRISVQPGSGAFGTFMQDESKHWELWKMSRGTVVWVPAQGTGIAGDVAMTIDYDAYDGPLPNMEALSDNQDSVIGSVFEVHRLPLDPRAVMQESRGGFKFVRNSSDYMGDRREYDGGVISTCIEGVTGVAANALLGKLWLEFELWFKAPQDPQNQRTFNSRTAYAFLTGDITGITGDTTLPLNVTANTIGVNSGASGQMILLAGRYRFSATAYLQATTANTGALVTLCARFAAGGSLPDPITVAYGQRDLIAAAPIPLNATAARQAAQLNIDGFFEVTDANVLDGSNKLEIHVSHYLSDASPVSCIANITNTPSGSATTGVATRAFLQRIDA